MQFLTGSRRVRDATRRIASPIFACFYFCLIVYTLTTALTRRNFRLLPVNLGLDHASRDEHPPCAYKSPFT